MIIEQCQHWYWGFAAIARSLLLDGHMDMVTRWGLALKL